MKIGFHRRQSNAGSQPAPMVAQVRSAVLYPSARHARRAVGSVQRHLEVRRCLGGALVAVSRSRVSLSWFACWCRRFWRIGGRGGRLSAGTALEEAFGFGQRPRSRSTGAEEAMFRLVTACCARQDSRVSESGASLATAWSSAPALSIDTDERPDICSPMARRAPLKLRGGNALFCRCSGRWCDLGHPSLF